MRTCLELQRRRGNSRYQFREIERADLSRRERSQTIRQRGGVSSLNRDEVSVGPGARPLGLGHKRLLQLVYQKSSSSLQNDRIATLRGIEGSLKVSPSRNAYGCGSG